SSTPGTTTGKARKAVSANPKQGHSSVEPHGAGSRFSLVSLIAVSLALILTVTGLGAGGFFLMRGTEEKRKHNNKESVAKSDGARTASPAINPTESDSAPKVIAEAKPAEKPETKLAAPKAETKADGKAVQGPVAVAGRGAVSEQQQMAFFE